MCASVQTPLSLQVMLRLLTSSSGQRSTYWPSTKTPKDSLTRSTHISIATTRAIQGVCVVALIALGGCANMSSHDQNTVGGAALGAVAGAVLTGGSAIGTVGGAAVGGVIGNNIKTR